MADRINISSISAAHEIATHIFQGEKTEFIEIALSHEPNAPVARLRGSQAQNELRFIYAGAEMTNATVTIERPDEDRPEGGISHSSSSSNSRTIEDALLTAKLLTLAADVLTDLVRWTAAA